MEKPQVEGPHADGEGSGGASGTSSHDSLLSEALRVGSLRGSSSSLAGTVGVAETLFEEQLTQMTGVDRYLQVSELGRGGMGRVDIVFDRALGRSVAKKRVLDPRHATLLIAEAQICAQLEHPSIVPLYDLVGDVEGLPTYTMRVIRGVTLRDVLDASEDSPSAMGLTAKLGVFRQVCLAVEYAHSRGVVHRDLKPDNVIVGGFGEVYVLDWGVAFVLPTSDIHRTGVGAEELMVAGSPGYMAPEQALGGTIGPGTDVFALGVILFEILSGKRPFADHDLQSILEHIRSGTYPPAETVSTDRIPGVLDAIVRSCLRREPSTRPRSARSLADTIDTFLDAEKARANREREASIHAAEGLAAKATFEHIEGEVLRLREEAQSRLQSIRPWEPPEAKQSAWTKLEEANRLEADGARAIAQAEASFARALGRVPNHGPSRSGLAALYFRQFEAAEARRDALTMAHHLDLARAYDDGALALELADQGALSVTTWGGEAEIFIARYEPEGLRLVPGRERQLGRSPTTPVTIDSGSYVVVARRKGTEVRYPLMVRRAKRHVVHLDFVLGSVPSSMISVASGPFLAVPPRTTQARRIELGAFAISRFPVTFREYAEFLDACDEDERRHRIPGFNFEGKPLIEKSGDAWVITPHCIEGEAQKRIPEGRELDLPTTQVSWFDAVAYASWRGRQDGVDYRLPSDLEWEKAMRGADGRSFPMGHHLDPSFAKLRESRPEATQPEPVGAFPLDSSPYGVRDLAGGVGDWTSTSIDGAPLPPLTDERSAEAGERQAFWRGGNWGSSATSHGMRYPMRLSQRTSGVGFRLAMSIRDDRSGLVVERMSRDE